MRRLCYATAAWFCAVICMVILVKLVPDLSRGLLEDGAAFPLLVLLAISTAASFVGIPVLAVGWIWVIAKSLFYPQGRFVNRYRP